MSIGKKIVVKNNKVSFISRNGDDYISLTDIARYKNSEEPKDIVKNWMRNRSTIEFLGIWEKINNPDFKGVEFDSFRNEAGSNAFVLSPQKWIETTQAIGMISKSGRYGCGTYAHKDIAFEFAACISSEFRFYLIKKRLIPPLVSKSSEMIIYANEADILNMALFGMTAKEWRDANSSKEGNIRDYSSVEQLVVLANLESLNAEYILQGMSQGERLKKLNEIAIRQMRSLLGADAIKKLV